MFSVHLKITKLNFLNLKVMNEVKDLLGLKLYVYFFSETHFGALNLDECFIQLLYRLDINLRWYFEGSFFSPLNSVFRSEKQRKTTVKT